MNELEIKIQLEILITEREGMIAENNVQGSTNNYYPHDEQSFLNISEQMKDLAEIAKTLKHHKINEV